jgi:hypothetical protein
VQLGESGGPREAARVRREDARFAREHNAVITDGD